MEQRIIQIKIETFDDLKDILKRNSLGSDQLRECKERMTQALADIETVIREQVED